MKLYKTSELLIILSLIASSSARAETPAAATASSRPIDPSEAPISANAPLAPSEPITTTAAATPAEPVAATAAAADPENASSVTEADWPREINHGDQLITIYQPQIESWKDNQLKQRSAVSVQEGSNGEPIFGVAWMSARTEVDKATSMVTLENIQVTKTSFPSAPQQNNEYKKIFQQEAPGVLGPISLEHLQASLVVSKADEKTTAPRLKNTPPKIIYSSTPSSLILIDGAPVLRESGAENLLRVINTPALILIDQMHGKAYLAAGDRWMQADSPLGPFQVTDQKNIPVLGSLNQVKATANSQKQIDLLDEQKGQITDNYKIYVSTSPAELIQTKGPAQMKPMAETQLLYAENSGDDIFLDTKNQNYYVLISGRWYRSKSLDQSWSYVDQKSLPQDFAQIPNTNPKGDVLASVAGTPQAKEAVISNQIPQTATVDRNQNQAIQPIAYDGEPHLAPILGTPLEYVVNSPVAVIEVNPQAFYSVQNGIWFVSSTPNGPWVIATHVPSVIYTIPPSSPLYYVTFVYVYGYTPRYVYVGYRPGYLGSYVTSDGVVVYGTGYAYHPWIGAAWYGYPVTYGFGVAWGVGFGWGFHIGYYGGYYAGPAIHPWWGPWRGPIGGPGPWGASAERPVYNASFVNINRTNVYRSWNANVVRPSSIVAHVAYGVGSAPNARAGYTRASRANNVYADRSGHVYRHTAQQGWQRYQNHGWQGGTPAAQPARMNNAMGSTQTARSQTARNPRFQQPRELEQERNARAVGQQRYQAHHSRNTNRDAGAGHPSSSFRHGK
jgi:hypothetical protein